MRICNFHADTPCRLYHLGVPFESPVLQAGAYAHLPYRFSFEVYAFFSEQTLSDEEAWSAFFLRLAHFKVSVSRSNLPCPRFIIAVEDARLLSGKLERLAKLKAAGVRILTLVWNGSSIIGGAHNSDLGLTPFGKKVVEECFRIGIVPDLSHASDRLSDEVLEIAESYRKPVIASHSNFRSLRRIQRNQRDRQYLRIAELGGVSGVSMCPHHLSRENAPGVDAVVRHIEHGLALDPRALVLGTDFDGIERTPLGIQSTSSLVVLIDRLLSKGYSESVIDGLFFENGLRFLRKIFPNLHLDL